MREWTPADQAELDVLINALTADYAVHRQKCQACQPCEQLEQWRTHRTACRHCKRGSPCPEHQRFLDHATECVHCRPCPSLQTAIDVVIGWRRDRTLLSRAQALRAQLDHAA